jgi:SPP1 family predicted phage head-tail adaptor
MTGAGDLDRRITIERRFRVGSSAGNTVYEWRLLANVAARRLDVSDAERVAYGGIVSEAIRRFTIRAQGPQGKIIAADRIQYDGRTWGIMGVKETRDGRNRFLEITAKAGS